MLLLPPPAMLSVRLPFGGFYYSHWADAYDNEQDSIINHWQECRLYERDRLNDDLGLHGVPDKIAEDILNNIGEILSDASDFRSYMDEIAKAYADSFAYWLGETLDLTVEYEFEELTSPQFYNFETDKIYVKLSEATLSRIYEGLGEDGRAEAFADMFTSRDGFHSFYDNVPPGKPIDEWDHNELYALLTAWVKRQLADKGWHSSIDGELYEDLYETCYHAVSNAIDWGKLKEAVADTVAEHREELEEAGITLPPPRCTQTLELPL